jgi:hypothetical protein
MVTFPTEGKGPNHYLSWEVVVNKATLVDVYMPQLGTTGLIRDLRYRTGAGAECLCRTETADYGKTNDAGLTFSLAFQARSVRSSSLYSTSVYNT